MKVAVGSTNPVKVKAVKKVYNRCKVISVKVSSDVSHTPLTNKECIAGAKNRAMEALRRANADLGIGMGGGISKILNKYFFTGWCVVVNKKGKVGIGGGSTLELPKKLVEKVKDGKELGYVIDKLVGEKDTKKRYGAIGVFTNFHVTRQKAWEIILLYALAKFLRPSLYREW